MQQRYHEVCRDTEARLRNFAGDLFQAGEAENALEMHRVADILRRLAQGDPAPQPFVRARRRA